MNAQDVTMTVSPFCWQEQELRIKKDTRLLFSMWELDIWHYRTKCPHHTDNFAWSQAITFIFCANKSLQCFEVWLLCALQIQLKQNKHIVLNLFSFDWGKWVFIQWAMFSILNC